MISVAITAFRVARVADDRRMAFTRARDLAVVAAVGLILGYLVIRLSYQRLPPLPRLAGLAAALVGAGEAVAGVGLRRRLRAQEPGGASDRRGGSPRRPVPPLTAARAVLTAKATSLAGAALAGLWVGLLVYVAPSWSVVVAAAADGVTGLIGLAGSLIMVAGALFLEDCCRVRSTDR